MDILNTFVLYLFNPIPGRPFEYYYLVGIIVLLLLGLGIFIRVYNRKNKEDRIFRKLFKKYPSKLWTMAIALAIYLLARYNYIPFFSMRLLFYLIAATTLYLIYDIINSYLRKYPAAKKLHHEQMALNRYKISRKKKKKKGR
ncbi:hypothetical protein KJ951_02705 [Patescibacteria group bacterium]|nr:hypothetical protein [Patescibacteria group bacterium]MBU1703291.1 hypothetical protein [Patescibacteria group bacterium]MBU1954020.1 hypothetical protein [Patescibacteria group bacterium]